VHFRNKKLKINKKKKKEKKEEKNIARLYYNGPARPLKIDII